MQRAAAHTAGMLTMAGDTQRGIAAYPKLPPAAQVALLGAWAERHEAAAAPAAMAALQSDNGEVRAQAVQTAAAVGGPRAVGRLASIAAGGEDASLARECLARMRGAGVELALLRAAEGGKPEVRSAVLSVLAERPTGAINAALLTSASSSDSSIATSALRALARTAGADQVPKLVAILVAARSDEVRDAAQGAIVATAQRTSDRDGAAAALATAYGQVNTPGKVSILGAMADVGGSRALDELTQAVASPDADVKAAAVAALANAWSDARPMTTLLEVAQTDGNRSMRVQALRGYLRLAGADDRAPAEQRLDWVRQGLAAAQRPEEKRQALGVLRDVRLPEAVALAARSLDDPDVNAEAADTVIYLASPQRRGNTNLPAVTGAATTAALDKVVHTAKDDNVKSRAERLLQGP
jgi:HEAT repeat protein